MYFKEENEEGWETEWAIKFITLFKFLYSIFSIFHDKILSVAAVMLSQSKFYFFYVFWDVINIYFVAFDGN